MRDGLERELIKEAHCLATKISPRSTRAQLDRLNELIIQWVLSNPMPIELKEIEY